MGYVCYECVCVVCVIVARKFNDSAISKWPVNYTGMRCFSFTYKQSAYIRIAKKAVIPQDALLNGEFSDRSDSDDNDKLEKNLCFTTRCTYYLHQVFFTYQLQRKSDKIFSSSFS